MSHPDKSGSGLAYQNDVELGSVVSRQKSKDSRGELLDQQTNKASRWSRTCICVLGLVSSALVVGVITVGVYLIVGCYSEEGGDNPIINITSQVGAKKQKDPYSFDDIFNPDLRPKGYSGQWSAVGNVYTYRNSDGDLIEHDAETDMEVVLMPDSIFQEVGVNRYYVSPDREHVLLAYEYEKVWRHSFTAKYKIFIRNPDNPEDNLEDLPHGAMAGDRLRYAGWAPSAMALSFQKDGGLYYQENPTTDPQLIQHSDDPHIIVGIPDWLYEEDVLGTNVAHYWAPDSQHICFGVFDDSQIPIFSFPYYGPKTNMYTDVVDIPYPKAGNLNEDGTAGPNTQAALFVADMANLGADPVRIDPPPQLADQDHYFIRVGWRDSSHVVVAWTSRRQTHAIVMLCNVQTGTCQRNFEETINNGFTRVPWFNPRFVGGGDSYLVLVAKDEEEEGHWQHVALITAEVDAVGVVTFLTSGAQYVSSIVGYDPTRRVVYYLNNGGDPITRHLYRVGTPAADEEDRPAVCLSCDEPPEECAYVSASFSSPGQYYFFTCLGPEIPTYRLRAADDSKDIMLEDNAEVKARLEEKALPERAFLDINFPGGHVGKAEVFIPPDHESGKQYPILVYTYAGPRSQRVLQSFPIGGSTTNWLRYMSSTQKVVVASVDGRGTSGRSQEHVFELNRRLGTVEIEDQVDGGRVLRGLPAVDDSANSAIFGWSYGGFVVSHAIPDQNDVFRCGIAVAPVTHYWYYDTAYTERFMDLATADDNAAGYMGTDAMAKAANFTDKHFLLVHGTADDNVHFSNTAHLSRALTDAEVQFRELMYVDEDHGIGGSSRHLYRAFTDFLMQDCWPHYVPE